MLSSLFSLTIESLLCIFVKSYSAFSPAFFVIFGKCVHFDRRRCGLFIRIYEDNVAGRLDDERFAMMSKNYTEEQKTLKAEVKGLQQQIHEQEQQAENIE